MSKIRNAVGLAVGAVALVAVPTFGLAGMAGADTADAESSGGRPPRPQLTDEQRQCLADQGVTPPEKSADGTRMRPTDEQRAAMNAAAEACGLPAPGPRPASAPAALGS